MDLLKRHSGIVWVPGRFAGLLCGRIVGGLYLEIAPQKRGGNAQCIDDVALDLLKRHSGIVWDPGRFEGFFVLTYGMNSKGLQPTKGAQDALTVRSCLTKQPFTVVCLHGK